jgi:hypothetical protein
MGAQADPGVLIRINEKAAGELIDTPTPPDG